ncbi:MAG: segregation/condensation protein A [Planctomycetota bacterium]|jgi:segregation and condensation protein A|nr:segregation/condensation protein A [Planctomycetota bacterium]
MTDESKTTGHDPNGHDPNGHDPDGHGPDGRAPDGHGPDEYRVYLSQVFSGPLDLLLHLVKEQEVEISEVKISEVVDGYLEYVKDLEELDLELAGEFLVLAATLMSIKSRSLLPSDEVDLEDDLDPQDELIQRLIEYQRFRGAADDLGERYQLRAAQHSRGYRFEARDAAGEPSLDLSEISAWDLLSTFSRLLRETRTNRPHRVASDPRPLRWYVANMASLLRNRGSLELTDLVAGIGSDLSRETLVGAFCALLELVHLGVASPRQDEVGRDEIRVHYREGNDEDLEHLLAAARFADEEPETAPEAEVPPPAKPEPDA